MSGIRMTVGTLLVATALLATAVLAPTISSAARWEIAPGEDQVVGFRSKAPLESFDGKTEDVDGVVELDPNDLGRPIALEVRVDLASLDTGIKMRNRHMRENHLHTDRFPRAVFRAVRIVEGAEGALAVGVARDLLVEGELDLHGVKRTLSVPLTLVRLAAEAGSFPERLRIVAEFPVALGDHDIPRPGFLFAKLGEVQRVFVDVTGRRVPEAVVGD